MNSLYFNSFDRCGDVLIEDCPGGDTSVEIINIDEDDFRVLSMLTAFESLRVSRALGALFAFAYARGVRDARLRLKAG